LHTQENKLKGKITAQGQDSEMQSATVGAGRQKTSPEVDVVLITGLNQSPQPEAFHKEPAYVEGHLPNILEINSRWVMKMLHT
jgi:hypothetical protein